MSLDQFEVSLPDFSAPNAVSFRAMASRMRIMLKCSSVPNETSGRDPTCNVEPRMNPTVRAAMEIIPEGHIDETTKAI